MGVGQPGPQRADQDREQRGHAEELRQHPGAGVEERGRARPAGSPATGRPRPSRHQALTPNSSAPPEATRPGRIVIEAHGRSPKSATRPGPIASTMMPRRIGTERHTEARSVRTRMPSTVRGSRPWLVLVGLHPRLVARHPARGDVGRDRRRPRPRPGCRRPASADGRPPARPPAADRRRRRPQRSGCGRAGAGVVRSAGPAPAARPRHDQQPARDRDAAAAAAYRLHRPGHHLRRARSRTPASSSITTCAWSRRLGPKL